MDFFSRFFRSDFMPHGHCFFWKPEILWPSVGSDLIIAVSYYSIPAALVYFVRKRKDLAFNWMFLMFGAFILACGTTHAMGIWTVWNGTYRVDALIKAITALLSVTTAIMLWRLIPGALALPSPATLREANERLRLEIKERESAEMEVRRLNEGLEEQVRQRTRELERSNQELERFAYVASHDLQEPLRTIRSFTELMEKRSGASLDEKTRTYMDFILDGARNMSLLIDDLLAYSRVGRAVEGRAVVDLGDTLEKCKNSLRAAIEASGAVISSDRLPRVQGDPTLVRMLLQNLLSNAIKYRRQVPISIHVGASQVDGVWEVAVSDNGIGIESQHYDRIFELFERLHGRDKYDGSGMGLAICKKIADIHGSKIAVSSRMGEGSTFSFRLKGA